MSLPDISSFSHPEWMDGKGFGIHSYNKALAAGYTQQGIKDAMRGRGLFISEKAGNAMGADTTLYKHRGAGGQFGEGTLRNARAAGMTDAQIRSSLASSGLTIGDPAAKLLNVNAGYTYFGQSGNVKNTGSYGNSGRFYKNRAQLAPRGYGLDPSKGYAPVGQNALGYSPTFYTAGGTNDYDSMNTIFNQAPGTFNASNAGGGYSDPTFNEDNAMMIGGFGGGGFGAYGGSAGSTPVTAKASAASPVGNNNLKIGNKKTSNTLQSGSSSFSRLGNGMHINNSLTV